MVLVVHIVLFRHPMLVALHRVVFDTLRYMLFVGLLIDFFVHPIVVFVHSIVLFVRSNLRFAHCSYRSFLVGSFFVLHKFWHRPKWLALFVWQLQLFQQTILACMFSNCRQPPIGRSCRCGTFFFRHKKMRDGAQAGMGNHCASTPDVFQIAKAGDFKSHK